MSDVPTQPMAEPAAPPVPAQGPAAAPYDDVHVANVASLLKLESIPKQIGPYHIRAVIGEGGMGVVYEAEQRHPVKRVVAVKVIKLGMDTREVIARFESERQALAVMSHPNVAKVLDAGATDFGRPYFVMECVPGESITTFCDRNRYTTRQRLELFLQACAAIQHAHQKAIIHRDLKPSNILVMLQDGNPLVKVIDFGVAKALTQRLTERTLFTETGQLIGTPEYMSPEQAEMNLPDIDTRSDIFSLGAVLYELLTGALPLDSTTLRSAGQQEIQRIIREVEPSRPSTRISMLGARATEVAKRRQMGVAELARQLRGELEWIPLKAMRKDRIDRYATASELALDIQNYLENRPLIAGPLSAGYRLRKFLRRNRRGVAATLAMLLLLVFGISATTWQAIRATRAERQALLEKQEAELQRQAAEFERERAEAATEDARAINQFLTEDLLASAAPEVSRGRETTVREALDHAADSVAERFAGRPLTEAAVRAVLADTYDSLGLTERALEHAQAAQQIHLRERGPDHESTLEATRAVGMFLSILNRHAEAEATLRDVLARCEKLLGPDHEVTISCIGELAGTLRRQRRHAEAEALRRHELEANRRVHGPNSLETANSLNSLGTIVSEQNRDAEAEPLLREALAIQKQHGSDHPYYLTTLGNLGKILQRRGNLVEAEIVMREALEGRRRVLKDDHRSTMLTMNDLSWIYAELGKFDEAEALGREVLSRRQRLFGENDLDTLQSTNALGRILTLSGKYDQAEQLLLQTIQKRREVLGELHAHTLGSMSSLAELYERQERFEDAEALLAQACEPAALEKTRPERHADLLARLGWCRLRVGRYSEAEPPLRQAYELLRESRQETSDEARLVINALAEICDRSSRPDAAARWRAQLASLPAPASPATLPGGN